MPETCSIPRRCVAAVSNTTAWAGDDAFGKHTFRKRSSRMSRIVVTGGGGFVGSHLCEALLARGDQVVAVDNFSTSRRDNVAPLLDVAGFELIVADVTDELPVTGAVDGVLHLACPASPPEYLRMPLETLDVCSIGTRRALDLARANSVRFLIASTSEVYGDPLVHPQVESYSGNVDPVGPRAV